MKIKPWMIAALLGALFGLTSRRWLTVDVGFGQTFEHPDSSGTTVIVIAGMGNTIFMNRHPVLTSPSQKESSHAEGA